MNTYDASGKRRLIILGSQSENQMAPENSPRGWAEVLCSANISIHIQHLQRFQKDR